MKIKLVSLGCKVNQYETQALAGLFEQRGFVRSDTAPDVVVINSCSVTSLADRKSRAAVRRAKRESPNAVIALTGCMPQTSPDEAGRITEADIVLGTRDRRSLVLAVENFLQSRRRAVSIPAFERDEPFEELAVDKFDDSFQRAYIKIEDGCDRFCSYCVIPYARGRVRSRPIEDIKAETARLYAAGYREMVLTGINLSRYGSDMGLTLADAVGAVNGVDGDFRIRLGSVEPDLVSRGDWQRLSGLKKLCAHFHLPLQSGCDETLSRMGRKYTVRDYLDTVSYIRTLFDNPSFTTDIIVGFPGESEEEFEDTCQTVQRAGLLRAHVFEYSPRHGTPAAELAEQLSPKIKKSRSARLARICAQGGEEFAKNQVGRTARLLVEKTGAGYTDNYLYVELKPPQKELAGSFVKIKITDYHGAACEARLVDADAE